MSGQKKEEDKKRGLGIEEEKRSKKEKGSQTGEIGRSLVISDRESLSGKSLSDTFPSAIVGVDGAEDRFYAKEKSKVPLYLKMVVWTEVMIEGLTPMWEGRLYQITAPPVFQRRHQGV